PPGLVRDPAGLGTRPQVVPVVEHHRATVQEAVHRLDVPRHGLERAPLVPLRVVVPQPLAPPGRHARRAPPPPAAPPRAPPPPPARPRPPGGARSSGPSPDPARTRARAARAGPR